MADGKKLESFLKGSNMCVKCGNKIPHDEVGGKCEIIQCPKCSKEKSK